MKYKGRFQYFTKDKKQSEKDYLQWVQSVWLPSQDSKKPRDNAEYTVLDVVELYLSWVYQNKSKQLFQSYRSYLRPITAICPTLPLTSMDVKVCEALKVDMVEAGYKPTTINHSLKAIRRMVTWLKDQEPETPVPYLGSVRVEVPRTRVKALTKERVLDLLDAASDSLKPWLVLNYLCCARPSEIVRLAHGDGEWLENTFVTKSKVGGRTGFDRFLLFSEEAMSWVPHLTPRFSTHDSYGKEVRKLGMGGPRQLRAAGSSHLRAAGVSYKDVRVVLGHTEAGAVVHYVEEDFSTVLPLLNQLSVLPFVPD